jgi:hypothetical protein
VKAFGITFHVLLALFLNARNAFTNDFLASVLFVTRNYIFYEDAMRSMILQNIIVPILDLSTLLIAGFYYMAVVRAR